MIDFAKKLYLTREDLPEEGMVDNSYYMAHENLGRLDDDVEFVAIYKLKKVKRLKVKRELV
jgi:hypothetical protein